MNYEERKAMADHLYNKPPGEDLPGQKFKRGSRVKVDDVMPDWMSHFECGFEGIIEHTYGQKFGGSHNNEYCLTVLDKEGYPINSISWYDEDQLTLINEDIEAGIKIIEMFKALNP